MLNLNELPPGYFKVEEEPTHEDLDAVLREIEELAADVRRAAFLDSIHSPNLRPEGRDCRSKNLRGYTPKKES